MSGLKTSNCFGVYLIFIWVSLFPGIASPVNLIPHIEMAQEGRPFSLSCTKDSDLLKVYWIRNGDIIFKSQSDANDVFFDATTNYGKFQVVSGRITVSTSLRQHNVTLRINTTLDEKSEWRCRSGGDISNTITIHVIPYTAVASSSSSPAAVGTPKISSSKVSSTAASIGNNAGKTSPSTAEKSSNENGSTESITSPSTAGTSSNENGNNVGKTSQSAAEKSSNGNGSSESTTSPSTAGKSSNEINKLIYIVAGSAGGVVLITIVVVAAVCIVRRKHTQDTSTKDTGTSQNGLHLDHESQHNNNEPEMFDNVLYSGYADDNYNTVGVNTNTEGSKAKISDDARVTDVYAQVQKRNNKTEVQVTVNIEDLYAKPVKKKKKEEANISVHNNVNINIGQIREEDV